MSGILEVCRLGRIGPSRTRAARTWMFRRTGKIAAVRRAKPSGMQMVNKDEQGV